MALRKREKILVGLTTLLVLAFVVRFLFSLFSGATGGLEETRDKLAHDVHHKKQAVSDGRKAEARLTAWQKRSLPADHEIARSLYQNWLSELVEQVGFHRSRVESGEGHTVQKAYYLLPFTIRGQATMEQLVRFLFQFYQAGHLHQIRHLSIKPVESVKGQENSNALELVITIETLSLPGASRPDKLSSEPGKELAVTALDNYSKVIVGRNLFSPYTASGKPPPTDATPPPFDLTKFAYLTAVLDVGGRPQAWLISRTTDQTFKLSEGDEFTIGPLHGKVTRIGNRKVELEIDGARYQVALGNNLHDSMQPPAPKN